MMVQIGREFAAGAALAAALLVCAHVVLDRTAIAATADSNRLRRALLLDPRSIADKPSFEAQMLLSQSRCPSVMFGPGVPTFKKREQLGAILQEEGMARGLELGVQRGKFSEAMLSQWENAREYHLADIWAPLDNYEDLANKEQGQQDAFYEETLTRLQPWKDKLHVCRDFTSNCVSHFEDNYFDFIYVDARHDFEGVLEDLVHYWPKLRPGGIMAGHDYVTQAEVRGGQDWTRNFDGTVDETGTVVKGAVDNFARDVCRQVTVSYREGGWNTWAIRK